MPYENRIPFIGFDPTRALKGFLQVFCLGDKHQVHHVALASLTIEDTWRQIIHHLVQLGRTFSRMQQPCRQDRGSTVDLRSDFRTFHDGAGVATGEQENRRGGQKDQGSGDHGCGHQLGTGASFYFLASTQADPIAVDQLYRIEFQGYFAANSQDSPALNSSDGAASHGSGWNDSEASKVHISHHDKIQEVSNVGVGRGNAFGKSKLNGSTVWNGQPGRNRSHLLGRETRHEKHREQDVSRYFVERCAEQFMPPLLEA